MLVNVVAHRPFVVRITCERSNNTADVLGWSGVAQCSPNKGCSILGQLANDTSPTPSRCNRVGPTVGRTHVPDTPRRLPHPGGS